MVLRVENDAFYEKAKRSFRTLFNAARAKHELHFAMALAVEMLGARDNAPAWNTAAEAHRALPNANKILKDLIGHAEHLGFEELVKVFRDAFDADVRNGYAHADYVAWSDGLRLPSLKEASTFLTYFVSW